MNFYFFSCKLYMQVCRLYKMIGRHIESEVRAQVGKYPVITITGPRQSGKTTLIKNLFSGWAYFSLEDPDTRNLIERDPRGFFQEYGHRLVLDEVQRLPILLSYIQGVVDNDPEACFILSGSHNMLMMENVSQTLAGRTTIFYLHPLSYAELKGHENFNSATELIWKGGYPRIFQKDLQPDRFYRDYLATYVERDVRQVKNIGDLSAFDRFLRICAGFAGQTINQSSLAEAAGVNRITVNSWLSVLETSYIIYRVQPYYKNFKKRLVKSPKLYFHDTGLACALLDIRSPEALFTYYQRGALFENFIFNEIAKAFHNRGEHPPLYYWRDSNQREIDLIVNRGTGLQPIEIKSGATYNKSYFKQLDWFAGIADVPILNPKVIYGGDEVFNTPSGEVLSWRNADRLVN